MIDYVIQILDANLSLPSDSSDRLIAVGVVVSFQGRYAVC